MKTQIFTAIIPLVLFWAVEEFLGLKAALIAGCVAAVVEVSWEKWTKKKVSFLTLASNALVLGLGAVSFVMDSGVAFKLQPMVMEIGMAGLMLGMRLKGGEPFFLRTFKDAPTITEEQRQKLLSEPWFKDRLKMMDTRLVLFLVFHGLAVGWAAVWGSTRMWILLKGVLFYVLMVVVFLPMMYKRPRGIPAQRSQ